MSTNLHVHILPPWLLSFLGGFVGLRRPTTIPLTNTNHLGHFWNFGTIKPLKATDSWKQFKISQQWEVAFVCTWQNAASWSAPKEKTDDEKNTKNVNKLLSTIKILVWAGEEQIQSGSFDGPTLKQRFNPETKSSITWFWKHSRHVLSFEANPVLQIRHPRRRILICSYAMNPCHVHWVMYLSVLAVHINELVKGLSRDN